VSSKSSGLYAGPVVAIVLWMFADLDPDRPETTAAAGVAAWMAIWWVTEAVPLAVTAMLPTVLFPLTGVMSGKDAAAHYFNHVILLFLGGFVVALAMQRWDLHRRIALRCLLLFGTRPRGLLLGFMVGTAFLSMWISNTATTMMMIPIALAVVGRVEENGDSEFGKAVFLGIAFSASIGGAATLVGTPPNLSLARIFAIQFPGAPEIDFASWILLGLPIAGVMIPVTWLLLLRLFSRSTSEDAVASGAIRQQVDALGKTTREEWIVLGHFCAMALLWLTRRDLNLGSVALPGWGDALPTSGLLNDGTVAIAVAVSLFVFPTNRSDTGRLMEGSEILELPWHIVLLFGGGFALAQGFFTSGLSAWFGQQLTGLGLLPPLVLVLGICVLLSFLTELTSNTATAEMFLPILAALAVAIQVHPLLLMVPGALSCSFAFMLPVATPPNAIVFGTDRVRASDMARAGIGLNLIGALTTTLAIYILGPFVGIQMDRFPDWAIVHSP